MNSLVSAPPRGSGADARVQLAVIAPVQAPYRLAFHRRIVRELPVRLHSIYTHRQGLSAWAFREDAETNSIDFSNGDPAGMRSHPRHAARNFARGGRIIRYLEEHRIDAALVVGYNDPGMLRIIRHNAAVGRPQLLWGDSNAAADFASGAKLLAKRALVGWVLRRCDAVLPCGRLGVEFFRRYGAGDDRMFLCPIEPDYELIQSLSPERTAATAQRFGLSPGRRRFVYCGRLVHRKRIDLVIDVFNRVADRLENWDLVLIGDGPDAASLRRRLRPDLAGRVTWTGFLDDQEAISALYRSCDVLVHPCDFEPWGLIILEAAAAGLGIITTETCGAGPELVETGRNGALVRPDDAAALERAMLSAGAAADGWRRESEGVFHEFRARCDSVRGLRHALEHAGVLPRG